MKKSLSAVVLAIAVTLLMAGNSHAIDSVPFPGKLKQYKSFPGKHNPLKGKLNSTRKFQRNPKIFNRFYQLKKKANLRSKRRTTIPRVSKNQKSSRRTQYQGLPSSSRIRSSRNTYITSQDGVRGGDPIDPFAQPAPPSTSADNDSSNETVALAEPNLVTAPTVSITPGREKCHWEWKVSTFQRVYYSNLLAFRKVTNESLEAKGIMRKVCVWVK